MAASTAPGAEVARRVPALALVVLAAGCAGGGEGLDANGRPLGESAGGALEPTIESLQDNVFTPICVQCHLGAAAPQGLVLSDPQTSYDNLVGVPSVEAPQSLRVRAGDPDGSYVIHKLEGTQVAGNRMPNGCPTTQPCLNTDTIAVIRQWIADGAAPPLQ
jgi:hypothetical protein